MFQVEYSFLNWTRCEGQSYEYTALYWTSDINNTHTIKIKAS